GRQGLCLARWPRCAARGLRLAADRVERGRCGAWRRVKEICAPSRWCSRLPCELGCRQLRPCRRGYTGGAAEGRYFLVVEAHQRGLLCRGALVRARDRQFLPALCGVAQGSDIKIAIVILGATVAVTAAGRRNLASSIPLRGVAAIVETYLIYWSVVYFIARK